MAKVIQQGVPMRYTTIFQISIHHFIQMLIASAVWTIGGNLIQSFTDNNSWSHFT